MQQNRGGAVIERGLAHPDARILIVDDEAANVRLLVRLLATAGYTNVHPTTSPVEALSLFAAVAPDIVLLDMHMPDMDGIELMRHLTMALAPGGFLPMLMLTGDLSPEVRQRALAQGALDFVTKPFEVSEVLLRISNLLHTRMLHSELQMRADELEVRVQERTVELEQARIDILHRLALAADYRDDATGEHTRRVGWLTERIGLQLGMPAATAERAGRAAMLHDIGKIGVPDAILLKGARLTPAEFEVIKQHTAIGRDILAGSPAPLLQVAETIAYTHHERWDGTGYHGIVGGAIPVEGRIVAVADTFDAITNDRPYRPAAPLHTALIEMQAQRGTQFDPDVLDAFMRLVRMGELNGGPRAYSQLRA
jgi:putative two-component system response regulator